MNNQYDNPKLDYNSYLNKLIQHYNDPSVEIYFKYFWRFLSSYLNEKQTIVDLGCGIGYPVEYLLKKYPKDIIYSVDINNQVLKYGVSIGTIKNPVNSSIYNLPFSKNFADIVFMMDILEHLEQPGQALKEVHRLIKDDGIVVIITPNGHWLYQTLRKILKKSAFMDPTHVYEYNYNEIISILEHNGYKILEIRGSNLPFSFINNEVGFQLSEKITVLTYLAYSSFWIICKKVTK